ncbi:MAG: sigma 54-interacting transcriptional regulator [Firmicutes bacterium]|nr:sigma 54-interacting transcriptional regulator [Bacillota bacterium]
MDQVLVIQKIQAKLHAALEEELCQDPQKVRLLLGEVSKDLDVFLKKGIDFKNVVDSLDDSIFITDAHGKCLYVNPAYQQNTSVLPEEVLDRNVRDIVKEGTLFTGGASLDVIEQKTKVFRLSTIHKMQPPQVGYAVGVPIFDDNGDLFQVVVSSRPIFTLSALQEDFQRFLDEANSLKSDSSTIRMLENTETPALSSSLIGSSPSLEPVRAIIKRVAPTDATVLITGESGVGKEIVADEIYKMGLRSDKPFVKVNCASIPLNLLESELFGYEKGAFSGASTNGKQGLFELANRGTLLLDEIGDMPMDLQAKLLRAIQSREITRVGGTVPIPLDIRFIASTNCDLKKKIEAGTFRQDLFYRLSVIPIHIPPLRDRLEDLDELCAHFVSMYCEKHSRHISLTKKHLNMMKLYNWPGHIRELENVIEYLTICSSGTGNVDEEMLQGLLNIANNQEISAAEPTLAESVEQHEKLRIESALRNSKNLREAGKLLGVNASTVSRKIRQYEISYSHSRE